MAADLRRRGRLRSRCADRGGTASAPTNPETTMAAIIIDGKTVAQQVRVNCRVRAEALHALGIHPGLAVVMVGDNSVSSAYVNSKVRACGEVGVHSEVHRLPRDVTDAGVLAIVDRLNRDSNIHGIIVQLPLP